MLYANQLDKDMVNDHYLSEDRNKSIFSNDASLIYPPSL